MSDKTTPMLAVFNSPGVSTYTVDKLENGNSLIKDYTIFKAGTFRDSMGIQRTWDVEHLFQMVSNFTALRTRDIFPNVPVRTDHSISVKDIVGYVTALRVDGNLLKADYEITEPDAFDKLNRGTYRSRSVEVGMFETNDEQFYWPVVHGFAYVDIPAVEGLHRGSNTISCFSAVDTKETNVPDPVTDPPEKPSDTGARRPEPVLFRVNGQTTTDQSVVQAHIDELENEKKVLEAFRVETTNSSRKAFIDSLASSNRIIQPQVAPFQELVLTMTPEQFEQFQKTYNAAPVQNILKDHANGVTDPDGKQEVAPGSVADNIAIQEGVIAMLRRSGKDDAFIANTDAYKKLAAYRAAAQ